MSLSSSAHKPLNRSTIGSTRIRFKQVKGSKYIRLANFEPIVDLFKANACYQLEEHAPKTTAILLDIEHTMATMAWGGLVDKSVNVIKVIQHSEFEHFLASGSSDPLL